MTISKEAQRLDDMMRKVEGLLAKADDPASTEHEATACRANAERIMLKYKIEQEDLIARGDLRVDGLNVMFKTVRVYPWASEFSSTYIRLVSYAMYHAGIKGVWDGYDGDERTINFVGYEADLRYAEMLYLNARLVFADRMEPKYDPSLSDETNVYRMRSAGIERGRIGEMMGWGDRAHQKVTRIYKRACDALGEEAVVSGRSVNVKDFRKAYAAGFEAEFSARLRAARIAVEDEVKDGGMVLHGREERINEAMYNRWPSLRPPPPDNTPAKRGGAPVRARRWTKADEARWERENNATSQMARSMGKKAASEIDVSGNSTPRKRLT